MATYQEKARATAVARKARLEADKLEVPAVQNVLAPLFNVDSTGAFVSGNSIAFNRHKTLDNTLATIDVKIDEIDSYIADLDD